jgi:ATP-binding cassette subfamily B (MDR/TAP) protein 1
MEAPPPVPFETCQEYWDSSSQDMRELSFKVAYGLVGILAIALIGHTLVHVGFGTATERMNKRVRDASFGNLVRQEVAYFDVRPVAVITSELSDDAAMIHAFSGEPIRTLVMNLASVFVGVVVSFVYMWYVGHVLHTMCFFGLPSALSHSNDAALYPRFTP